MNFDFKFLYKLDDDDDDDEGEMNDDEHAMRESRKCKFSKNVSDHDRNWKIKCTLILLFVLQSFSCTSS